MRDFVIDEGTSATVNGAIGNANHVEISSAAPFATVALNGDLSSNSFSVEGTSISLDGSQIDAAVGNGSFAGAVTIQNDVAIAAADILFFNGDVNSDVAGDNFLTLVGLNQLSMLGGSEIGTSTPLGGGDFGSPNILDMNAVSVTGVSTFRGGLIDVSGTITAGLAAFAPFTANDDFNVYNQLTAPGSATNFIDLSTLNNVVVTSGVRFGDANTGTLTIFNDNSSVTTMDLSAFPTTIGMGSDIVVMEKLDAGANDIRLRVHQSLTWMGLGSVVSGDELFIDQITALNNTTINGPMRDIGDSVDWQSNLDVIVDGAGGDVEFTSQVGGGDLGDFTVSNTGLLSLNHPTSASFAGEINISANSVNVSGGLVSSGGDVTVNGSVNLTGGGEIVAGNGQSVNIGNVDGGGQDVLVRSFVRSAGLDTITLGNVSNAANVILSRSPSNTVNLDGATSDGGISVRGNTINLQGTFTANDGNLHLVGSVMLVGNTTLNHNSASNGVFIVQGTLDGGFDFDATSVAAPFAITGAVGGVTPLANMTVNTPAAQANLGATITVAGDFEWNAGGKIVVKADIVAGGALTLNSGVAVQLRNGATLTGSPVTIIP